MPKYPIYDVYAQKNTTSDVSTNLIENSIAWIISLVDQGLINLALVAREALILTEITGFYQNSMDTQIINSVNDINLVWQV